MNEDTRAQGKITREMIYYFIVRYVKKHGYSPTIREIGDGVYLSSSSSVHNHLKRMFDEGILETDDESSPRAIRVPGYEFRKIE